MEKLMARKNSTMLKIAMKTFLLVFVISIGSLLGDSKSEAAVLINNMFMTESDFVLQFE